MPTVFNEKGFRFFFSNEEDRMRVHVHNADGEMKIWMEPEIETACSAGMSAKDEKEALSLAVARKEEIRDAWNRYFGK